MKKTRTGYEILQATIAEMSADPAEFDIPIDAPKVKGILERGKDPRFVTLQVAREGVSVNGRNYSADVITSIAEQINTRTIPSVAPATSSRATNHTSFLRPRPSGSVHLQLMKEFGKNVAVSISGKAKEAVYDAKFGGVPGHASTEPATLVPYASRTSTFHAL